MCAFVETSVRAMSWRMDAASDARRVVAQTPRRPLDHPRRGGRTEQAGTSPYLTHSTTPPNALRSCDGGCPLG